VLHRGLAERVGQQTDRLLDQRGHGAAVRFHADAVQDGVRAASAGHRPDGVADAGAVERGEVDDVDALLSDAAQPVLDEVDADDAVAELPADPAGEVADRSEAEHDERPALGDLGVGDPLPGGRQDVGQVGEAVVRGAVGQRDVRELRLGDAQVLGLTAGHRPVQLAEPEQRGAAALRAHLRRLALGVELPLAHPAVPAGDLERDADPVADAQVAAVRPDLLDDPHGLVPEHVAPVHERGERLVQVQVGAADVGRGHLDDGVSRLHDLRVRHLVHRDAALALPRDCLQRTASRRGARAARARVCSSAYPTPSPRHGQDGRARYA
jgi:hypothetical protein